MADYIKRDSVVAYIENLCNKAGNDDMCFSLNWVARHIKEIPAADVRENVYADCIKLHNDPYIMWKCGNCGWLRDRTSKPKFCEECGAEFLPAVRGDPDGDQ